MHKYRHICVNILLAKVELLRLFEFIIRFFVVHKPYFVESYINALHLTHVY